MYALTPSPIQSSDPPQLTKQNSLVFVSQTHGVWSNVETRRRPSKRYGHLIQSPTSGLSEMLMHHREDVFKWIEDRADDEESEGEEEAEVEQQRKSQSQSQRGGLGQGQRGSGSKSRSPIKRVAASE